MNTIVAEETRKARPTSFPELRPFYLVTWVGIITASITGALMFVNLLTPNAAQPTLLSWIGGLCVLIALVGLTIRHLGRVENEQSHHERQARATETARMSRNLERLRAILAEATPGSEILVVPGEGVLAWTARSRERPLVLIEAGLWAERAKRDLDVVVLHEAAHVAAGDVETFHRLLAGLRAFFAVIPPLLVLSLVIFGIIRPEAVRQILLVGVPLTLASLALLGAWSSLLVMRELQADLFAADWLNDDDRVRRFIEGQGGLRSMPWHKRVWTGLIQPERTFRRSLPARTGRLGRGIEQRLGFALSAFTSLLWTLGTFFEKFGIPGAFWFGLVAATGCLFGFGYVFAWWSGRRWINIRFGEHVRAGFRVAVAAVIPIVAMAAVLQLSLGTTVARAGAPVWEVLLVNLVLAALVTAVGVIPWCASSIALVFDIHRRPVEGPRFGTAIVGFASTLIAGFIGGTLAAHVLRSTQNSVNAIGLALGAVSGMALTAVAAHLVAARKKN